MLLQTGEVAEGSAATVPWITAHLCHGLKGRDQQKALLVYFFFPSRTAKLFDAETFNY